MKLQEFITKNFLVKTNVKPRIFLITVADKIQETKFCKNFLQLCFTGNVYTRIVAQVSAQQIISRPGTVTRAW